MATVGGRMEAVVRPRSLAGADYARIAVLVAASLGVHLWLVAHTAVTARDGLGFARYALCIQSPHASEIDQDPKRLAIDVIRKAEQAPGYPLCVWVTAKFVRNAVALPHSESTLLAAQLVSAIAAALLTVPMYLMGRMLFGRPAGFAAALLFQVLPTPARVTSDGLTEGVYLLAVGAAVLLGMRAVRKPGVGGFLLCGFAVGACSLVRLEGMMVAPAVGLVALWMGVTKKWPRDLAFGRLTALAVGVAMVAVPYMMLIGKVSNKPTANQFLNPGQQENDALWKKKVGTSQAPAPAAPLFGAFWNDSAKGNVPAEVVAAGMVAKELAKSSFYAPLAIAVFGLIALRKRIVREPGAWVLLVLGGSNIGVLLLLGTKVGYVSERHTLLLVLIACVFAGAALEPLAAALSRLPRVGHIWAGKFAPVGLLLALVVAALPATLKPMHPQREGHKHAGKWLKEHATSEDVVIDPFCWAEWYAERALYYVPPDPPDAKVLYVVLDDKMREDQHTRLPRLGLAKEVAASGTVVYWWPENVPQEQAKVRVVKTVR